MALSDQIIAAESGGDPNAANPNSSAVGPGQFIDSTWVSLIRQNRPDLAAGKSDAAILGMRTDPDLSRQMVESYAQSNAKSLTNAGFEASPGNLYLSHFAGPGGAIKILGANPGASAAAILGPSVAQANPFLKGWTVSQLTDWAARKVGGSPVSAPAGSSPTAGAVAPASSAVPVPPAAAMSGAEPNEGDQLGDAFAQLSAQREQEDQLRPMPLPPLNPMALRLRSVMARLNRGGVGAPFASPVAQRLLDVIGNRQA